MKRLGAVIHFKEGIDLKNAQDILKRLEDADLLDASGFCSGEVVDGKYVVTATGTTPVHEYDDRYGGPVWYIP